MQAYHDSNPHSFIFSLLALIWGVIWAAFLQYVKAGRWLAIHRTWLTVVIGVGVDLVILLPILPRACWWRLLNILSWSSVGIIARSLYNEFWRDTNGLDA